MVCAVRRRRFPVADRPTSLSLRPEATRTAIVLRFRPSITVRGGQVLADPGSTVSPGKPGLPPGGDGKSEKHDIQSGSAFPVVAAPPASPQALAGDAGRVAGGRVGLDKFAAVIVSGATRFPPFGRVDQTGPWHPLIGLPRPKYRLRTRSAQQLRKQASIRRRGQVLSLSSV